MSSPGSSLLMFLCGQPAYLKWLECNSIVTLWWWLLGSELLYPLTDIRSPFNIVYLYILLHYHNRCFTIVKGSVSWLYIFQLT